MHFPHILVITASAGSGKTSKLSERYINFILSPAINTSPRNILAITFTNKAAVEMKNRIISKLKEIAMGDSEQKESATKKLNALLDKYSDLKIQTIDSFLTSVTTVSALELGLPPNFEIILDSFSVINFVFDELLSQVYPTSQEQDKEITHLFLDLLVELMHMNPELGWDIKKIVLENIISLRNLEIIKGEKIKRIFSPNDLENKRKSLVNSLTKFLEMSKNGLNFKASFINAVNKFVEGENYPLWKSEMFKKAQVDEICKNNSILTTASQKMWQEIKENISSFAEITSHCLFAPFINMLSLFDEGINSFKKRQQIIFIEDLSIKLKTFLYKDGIVPEIYFHLGDRISHFFIDEFQDTSRLHWNNLFPLIEEALSKAGSLFYVGDKKQAIYSFRGGESALFDEAKKQFTSIKEEDIKKDSPKINYRSRKNIVSFVNKTFSEENLTTWIESCNKGKDIPNLSLIFETYAHCSQKTPPKENQNEGLVRVEIISPDKPQKKEYLDLLIEERLVGLINNDILKRSSPSDIAILVRTNIEASWVTTVLSSAGIPVSSEKTLDISSNNLVQEIVSFLSFLDAPMDNFSFACFISGEIFHKTSLLSPETILSFLLQNRKTKRPLYAIFRNQFPDIWQNHLQEYFHGIGFLPPYDLVSRIFKKYNILLNFPEDEGFLYQLLEVLKQCETEGKNSLKAFLTLWRNSKEKRDSFQVVLPEYANAVKVYTIHKAKGLGFPIVIIPFAYLNNKPITEVYEKDGYDLIPYRINQTLSSVSPKLKQLYQEKFTSYLIDELNAFYVAITRAKEELYIFLPNYEHLSQKLYPPIFLKESVFNMGSSIDRLPKYPQEGEHHIHPPLINDWQDKLYRPLVEKNDLINTARKKAKERGTFIHNFLANIYKLSTQWKDELKDRLASLNEEQKEIAPLMKHLFDNEDIRRWFVLPEEIKVYCEKEIIDAQGLRYRVDRVLVSPEEIIVIEFKSGEARSEEHQEQIKNYIKLLEEIYPDRKIEGYLIYIDE